MKRLIIGTLSVLLVSAATSPAVKAETAAMNAMTSNSTATSNQRIPSISPWLTQVNQTRGFRVTVPSSAASAVKAEAAAMKAMTSNSTSQLKPHNLVFLAYQGYFRNQGIPGYGALISGYQGGRITAKHLVQSAVKTNRLSDQTLSDRRFLRDVENQLRGLNTY